MTPASSSPIRSLATAAALAASIAIAAGPTAFAQADATRPTSMFEVYADNRDQGTPNYITADFVLLAYSALLDSVAGRAEGAVARDFKALLNGLGGKLREAGDDPVTAANRDLLFVVATVLLDPPSVVVATLPEAVRGEVDRIKAAAGVERSAIARQMIDYTQFRPRGRYESTPELSHYFAAMRYAGTVMHPLRGSEATGIADEDADRLTRQAAMLSHMVWNDAALKSKHEAIERRLSWLFGRPDDLSVADYGPIEAPKAGDDEGWVAWRKARQAHVEREKRGPRIVGGIVDASKLKPGETVQMVTTGWRLVPQRYTPDAAVFQELVHDRVGAYQGKRTPVTLTVINGQPVKGFPLGTELMSLLGSDDARQQLARDGEQEYEGYGAAADRAREVLSGPSDVMTDHLKLMGQWLKSGRSAGARRLNGALGFWTRLRHSSVLYAKQSYTAAGKGFVVGKPRRRAYVEPAAELYAGLRMAAASLAARLEVDAPELAEFGTLMAQTEAIVQRQTRGALSAQDVDFLNALDERLLALAGAEDRPVVVDVHTNPSSGEVLEEGVAFPTVVYRRMPDGTRARGALFTHVEFKQPLEKRLTDSEWRTLLDGGFPAAAAAAKRLSTLPEK